MGILSVLGDSLEKNNKFAEFEEVFKGDDEMINNAKATWLTSRGSHYGESQKIDDAISDFKKAINIKSDHLPAYLGLVAALNANGKTKEAEQVWFEAPEEMKIHGSVVATKTQIMNDALGES